MVPRSVFLRKECFSNRKLQAMALNYWFQPHSKEGVEVEGPHGVSLETPPSRRMIWERDFEIWLIDRNGEPPEMEKYDYDILSDTDSDPMEQERSRKLKEWMAKNEEQVKKEKNR